MANPYLKNSSTTVERLGTLAILKVRFVNAPNGTRLLREKDLYNSKKVERIRFSVDGWGGADEWILTRYKLGREITASNGSCNITNILN